MRSLRRRTFILLLCTMAIVCADALSCRASDGEAAAMAFNAGNAHYRAGEYLRAVDSYQEALAGGIQNASVHYNLGNAFYKAGDVGRAVLSYERGLRLTPSDPDLRANLHYVNARIIDRLAAPEDNAVTRFISRIYDDVDADALAVSCSLGLFLLCGAGITWLLDRGRPLVLGCVTAVAVCVTSGSGALLALKISDADVPTAVIVSEEAMGHSGPGEDFIQVFTLHAGTKITVEREEAGWVLVRLPNGLGGWTPRGSLENI